MAGRLQEVVELACLGRSDGEIASELGIGKQTVETHWKRLRKRFDTSSRVVVVCRYLRAKHEEEISELRKSVARASVDRHQDGEASPDVKLSAPNLREVDEAAHELQTIKMELANMKEACESLGLTLFKADPLPPFRVDSISGRIDKELGYANTEFEHGQRRFGSTARPVDAYEVNQHVLSAIESGKDHWETCYRAVDASGNEMVHFDFNVLVRDEDGKPSKLYGFTTPLKGRLGTDSQAIKFLNRLWEEEKNV
ncbi:MAG: LuxR C-terminal-related transcriptional regulator [Fimbriimonadaceae bacterium]